jgi:PD-(D/E)XK nuclease superfamily
MVSPLYLSGVTNKFLSDLEFVFATDASDDIPLWELKDLEKKLTKWSKYCGEELNERLSKLPMVHPVKCPISLYTVMEMGRLEVAHTATLAWLLDPKNEHGFGNVLTKILLRHICRCGNLPHFVVHKVEAERIYRNSLMDDSGRTDIWIEGSYGKRSNSEPWLVVIEAKIGASEGDRQLDRYNVEIKKWRAKYRSDNVHQIFLSPEGKEATSGKGWQSVSFSRLARIFLGRSSPACDETGLPFHSVLSCSRSQRYLGLADWQRRRSAESLQAA